MRTISEHQLRAYLGATGEELLKLRMLLDPDANGLYPEADAARILLKIRQGNRARDPITEQHRQAQERTRKLLGGRRKMTRD